MKTVHIREEDLNELAFTFALLALLTMITLAMLGCIAPLMLLALFALFIVCAGIAAALIDHWDHLKNRK